MFDVAFRSVLAAVLLAPLYDNVPPNLRPILPPANLHVSTDFSECQRHHGGLICGNIEIGAPNYLVLLWSAAADADAYHLYRTDGGQKLAVATVTYRQGGVLSTAQGLTGVEKGSCFSVAADRESRESALSAPLCLGDHVPVTVLLAPGHFRTASDQTIKRGGTINITGDPGVPVPPPNALYAGYLHDTNGHDAQGTGYESRNEYYRAGLWFDVSGLAGKQILKAVLHLRVYSTHHRGIHSNPDYYDHVSSCATRVASGTAHWWSYPDMIDEGAPSVAIAPPSVDDMQIDITSLVAPWAAGTENRGIVLAGDNEDLGAYTETICQTQFVYAGDGAPRLEINAL